MGGVGGCGLVGGWVGLNPAQAIYGGSARDQFMYSDSAYTMSQWSVSLEPGVDCPDRQGLLDLLKFAGNPKEAR